jgi:hypothetical protein
VLAEQIAFRTGLILRQAAEGTAQERVQTGHTKRGVAGSGIERQTVLKDDTKTSVRSKAELVMHGFIIRDFQKNSRVRIDLGVMNRK